MGRIFSRLKIPIKTEISWALGNFSVGRHKGPFNPFWGEIPGRMFLGWKNPGGEIFSGGEIKLFFPGGEIF